MFALDIELNLITNWNGEGGKKGGKERYNLMGKH